MPLGSGSEVDWPELSDLKKRLDITSDDWDGQLEVKLEAAIAQIKLKVGNWDEMVDEPNEATASAALELAVELATSEPIVPSARRSEQLLYGQRRRFGIG